MELPRRGKVGEVKERQRDWKKDEQRENAVHVKWIKMAYREKKNNKLWWK